MRSNLKIRSVTLTAVIALSLLGAGASVAERARRPSSLPIAQLSSLTADPLYIPPALQAQLNAAQAACNCFSSATAWEIPDGSAAEVFSSYDILFALVEWDIQLPWAGYGEVSSGALANLLGSQAGVLSSISQFADPSGHGYRIGAYKWSYMTAPDYCSSETLYLQYYEHTGVLFAWRFDSSSEC